MSRFIIKKLSLQGLLLIERLHFVDNRGFLSRLYCADELRDVGDLFSVEQINHTYTANRGTVRGMHFQYPPHAEIKLVNCLRGVIFDVAVDLRRDSPTFLKWHGEVLSADNRRGLLIPEGFAHGFQALSDEVELIYLHSAKYFPEAEAGFNAQDPKISISWPLNIVNLSPRDKSYPELSNHFSGINLNEL